MDQSSLSLCAGPVVVETLLSRGLRSTHTHTTGCKTARESVFVSNVRLITLGGPLFCAVTGKDRQTETRDRKTHTRVNLQRRRAPDTRRALVCLCKGPLRIAGGGRRLRR